MSKENKEKLERAWHFYLGIDNDTVWSIIQTDIPVLLLELKSLKESVLL